MPRNQACRAAASGSSPRPVRRLEGRADDQEDRRRRCSACRAPAASPSRRVRPVRRASRNAMAVKIRSPTSTPTAVPGIIRVSTKSRGIPKPDQQAGHQDHVADVVEHQPEEGVDVAPAPSRSGDRARLSRPERCSRASPSSWILCRSHEADGRTGGARPGGPRPGRGAPRAGRRRRSRRSPAPSPKCSEAMPTAHRRQQAAGPADRVHQPRRRARGPRAGRRRRARRRCSRRRSPCTSPRAERGRDQHADRRRPSGQEDERSRRGSGPGSAPGSARPCAAARPSRPARRRRAPRPGWPATRPSRSSRSRRGPWRTSR